MAAKEIHTPIGTAPVLPVMVMTLGAYLVWFGVHYWRSDTAWPSDPIKAVLTGKPVPAPDRSADEAAIKGIIASAGTSGAAPAATGSGARIATDAQKYIGEGYVFGGAAYRTGVWDCSSFVSYVLGHDLGMPLPGGKWGSPGFPPYAHGPTTLNYMMFGSPVTRSQAQAGDLIVSSEHMGIVTSPGNYISARTPAAGTGIGSYTGHFPGGTPVFRRVT